LLNFKDVVIGLAGELESISISDICCIEGNYHLLYLKAKKLLENGENLESFKKYLVNNINKTADSNIKEIISINTACNHLLDFINEYHSLEDFINDLKKLLISIEEGRMKFHEEFINNHDLKMQDFVKNLF